MSVLQKLLDLINSIDPEQVRKVIDTIKMIIDLFKAQGFQPKGFAGTAEEEQVVQACVAKGCTEAEAREVVKSLNA